METFEAGRRQIRVLFSDNHLLAVEKPPNMPVQRDRSDDLDLLTACKRYVAQRYQKPGEAYLGLVHRLDRPVGGVILLARTGKAAARLGAQFSAHSVGKRYLCVLRGHLAQPLALEDWLIKDERANRSAVVSEGTPGAKLARLRTRPREQQGGLTLCEVELVTGRAHQIRVQNAHAGFPLWGDARYGGGKPGEQLALWASRLTVEHPTLRQRVEFASFPPRAGIWARFQEVADE